MTTPQDPRRRKKEKAKRTKKLDKWREKQVTEKAPAAKKSK